MERQLGSDQRRHHGERASIGGGRTR
jgi:hypothetical protein